jgi:hypothetical protein
VTGQAHPADRGSEEVGVLLRRAIDHAAVGDPHLERRDVVSEVSILVLVLSVDVGSNHPPEGDELRAW